MISPRPYNRRVGLGFVLSHYLAGVKGYPFEVQLPADLEVEGAVLSDQIKSLDWRVRRARYACAVPAAILDEVLGKVLALIDPSEGG